MSDTADVRAAERDEKRAEIAQLLDAQAKTYAFLSRVFGLEADDALIGAIAGMRLPAETGNERLDSGYRNLVRYMNHSWERTRGELAADYLHTFLGNTQDVNKVAFPYESVYTSPERLLMQEARDDVLAIYRSQRVVLRDDINEPEDHIAYELEFMQLMNQRAAEALLGGHGRECKELLQVKHDFLQRHLMNWVPAFCADVKRISGTLFYRAMADILQGFVEVDLELTEELLGA